MHDGCAAWILAGGAHHTCYSQNLNSNHLLDFAEMAGIECVKIGQQTDLYHLKNELRWSEVYYR
jgi:L-arabinose isomerase